MLLCTSCPWDPYTSVRFLNPVCLPTPFGVCGCPYIGSKLSPFFCCVLSLLQSSHTSCIFSSRSFRSFTSSLSFLDWAEAEGHLQCSAGLAQSTDNRVLSPT